MFFFFFFPLSQSFNGETRAIASLRLPHFPLLFSSIIILFFFKRLMPLCILHIHTLYIRVYTFLYSRGSLSRCRFDNVFCSYYSFEADPSPSCFSCTLLAGVGKGF